MYKQLHEALQLLAEDERYLIVQLYFLEKTEREIAALEGIYHNAVHKRKLRILSKLKKLFEEIWFLGCAECVPSVEVSEGDFSISLVFLEKHRDIRSYPAV